MKKKSRMFYQVAAVVVALALLAACGNGATTTPPAPTPGTDAGAAGDVTEVTIGLLGPFTGPVAYFGNSVRQGAMLYIDEFNALGGLQIRVEQFDEEGDLALAVTGYHALYDRNVTAIIGSVTSGPTIAVVPEAYNDGMPMITASATHAAVTFDSDNNHVWSNMFRSCFIDPFQGVKMADFAFEVLEARTAAVLFSNDIDYSIGLMESFVERAGEIGLEIVAVENFVDDAISFEGQLINIAAVNPDVMFFPAYIRHVALMGPQSAAVGLDTIMLGADGWNGALAEMPDSSSIEGAYFLTGFTQESEDPRVQDFIANYTAVAGFAPNMFAAQAYDAAMILIAAIEAAIAEGHSADDQAAFRAAIIGHMSATDLTGVTGHITFDSYNNPQKTAFIVTVDGGQERFWGTF
ncbi:MAG: ABC transporter substrate-binding protein [Oscillospiraceae bacterium]|nr:ABC transporter substrate-binding protein [Oscillospiraceae bacterium]